MSSRWKRLCTRTLLPPVQTQNQRNQAYIKFILSKVNTMEGSAQKALEAARKAANIAKMNAGNQHAKKTNSPNFEIGEVIPLTGYYLLEYIPDDGRGRIAFVDKTPLIGFATAVVNNKFGIFPMTLRGFHFHAPDKPPTILCPCGGILADDVFLDDLGDYMQAMKWKHEFLKRG